MTTATLTQPIDLDHHWSRYGLCRPENSDLFTPGPYRGKELPRSVGYAVSICRRPCPVIDRCAEWRRAQLAIDPNALSGQIVAGIYHE